jgi:hypothetical protein
MWTSRSIASGRPAVPASFASSSFISDLPYPEKAGERGDATVATLVGFVVVLVLVMFAAQVITRLYATSVVTASATRAAEAVALSPSPLDSEQSAIDEADAELGSFAVRHARFVWVEVDDEQVVLRVQATVAALLPGPAGWRAISRTVTIRRERFQAAS